MCDTECKQCKAGDKQTTQYTTGQIHKEQFTGQNTNGAAFRCNVQNKFSF